MHKILGAASVLAIACLYGYLTTNYSSMQTEKTSAVFFARIQSDFCLSLQENTTLYSLQNGSFYEGIERIYQEQKDPFIEKFTLQFIKQHSSFLECHTYDRSFDVIQKTGELFLFLDTARKQKSYQTVFQGQDAYNRTIPGVNIVYSNTVAQTDKILNLCKPGVYEENSPYPVQSKEEADALVRHLHNITEIPWDYEFDGCDEKSDLGYQLLLLMQVPKLDLKIARIIRTSRSLPENKKPSDAWRYHATHILTLRNKERYILDPTMDPRQSLTFENWTKKFGSNFSFTYEEYDPNILENSIKGRLIRFIACPRFHHLYRDQYLAALQETRGVRDLLKQTLSINKP